MEFLFLIVGIFLGCGFTLIFLRFKAVGTLRIDTSDPDGPFMFLELSKNLDTMASKKTVVMKVSLKNYISHD